MIPAASPAPLRICADTNTVWTRRCTRARSGRWVSHVVLVALGDMGGTFTGSGALGRARVEPTRPGGGSEATVAASRPVSWLVVDGSRRLTCGTGEDNRDPGPGFVDAPGRADTALISTVAAGLGPAPDTGSCDLSGAEASPPEELPAVRSRCHGLAVTPRRLLSVAMRSPKSGRLVRPMMIAPAALRRSTVGASTSATASARVGTPWVVAVPATSTFSLIVTGTPCRGRETHRAK